VHDDDTTSPVDVDAPRAPDDAAHLAPNLAEASRFLALIDEDAESFSLRSFPDGRRGQGHNYDGTPYGLKGQTTRDNAQGRGLFFVVNAGGHTDDSIDRVRAVFADFDGTPMPERFDLEPHAIVNTSAGRYHVYWLVDGLPLEQFSPTQRAIAGRYGSDPSVSNLSRVMRLPGFIHRKPADPKKGHDGKPFRSHIIHESGALPYSAAKVLAAFPPVGPRELNGRTAPPFATIQDADPTRRIAGFTPDTVRDLRSALNAIRPDDRSVWVRIGCALHEIGGVGRGLWLDWSQASDKWKPSDASEWDTFDHDRTGYRAVFTEAQRLGWVNPRAGAVEATQSTNDTSSQGGKSRSSSSRFTPTITRASDLLTVQFADMSWAIKDLVPQGVMVCVGPPKIGKSFFILQGLIAVAEGSAIWPGRAAEVQGDVLYLALEDNDRRMSSRLKKLQGARGAVVAGEGKDDWLTVTPTLDRLHYSTRWARMHEGGLEAIEEWLIAHPGARLVAIDTLACFRKPSTKGGNAYEADYEIGHALKQLADKYGVSILLVHHTKKGEAPDIMDSVNGTTGINGSVDGTLILRRERGQMDAALFVTGRDIEREEDYALRFNSDTCLWSAVGTVADVQQSDSRRAILEFLEANGPSVPRDIATGLGKNQNTTRRMLQKMLAAGVVTEANGAYSLTPVNSVVSVNSDAHAVHAVHTH